MKNAEEPTRLGGLLGGFFVNIANEPVSCLLCNVVQAGYSIKSPFLKTLNSNRITEISGQGPSAHQDSQKYDIGKRKNRKIVPFFSRYFICNLSIRD